MTNEQLLQLKSLSVQIQSLSISDEHAKTLQELVQASISIISTLEMPNDFLFEGRKKTVLKGLEEELPRYLNGYWQGEEPLHKIAQMSRAREQAHLHVSKLVSWLQR